MIETVLDHRGRRGQRQPAPLMVRMRLDLELQAVAADRERGATGDEPALVLDAEADTASREVIERIEVVDERLGKVLEAPSVF